MDEDEAVTLCDFGGFGGLWRAGWQGRVCIPAWAPRGGVQREATGCSSSSYHRPSVGVPVDGTMAMSSRLCLNVLLLMEDRQRACFLWT